MKFCQKHWDMLRKAIEDRGLTHLIAKSGEQAAENMVSELRGEEHPYDPLMAAHWMISSAALDQGGLYMMTGDHCPVCEAIKHTAEHPLADGNPAGEEWVEKFWIDGPANAVLAECREKGLVPRQQ